VVFSKVALWGFILTLQPLLEKLKAFVSDLSLNVRYLDDGTLMVSTEDLAVALCIVKEEGPALGLQLNHSKSLLFIPPEADASQSTLPPDIHIACRGFSLLGCPIGPPCFCKEVLGTRLQKLKEAMRDLRGAQLESTLLCSCLSQLE